MLRPHQAGTTRLAPSTAPGREALTPHTGTSRAAPRHAEDQPPAAHQLLNPAQVGSNRPTSDLRQKTHTPRDPHGWSSAQGLTQAGEGPLHSPVSTLGPQSAHRPPPDALAPADPGGCSYQDKPGPPMGATVPRSLTRAGLPQHPCPPKATSLRHRTSLTQEAQWDPQRVFLSKQMQLIHRGSRSPAPPSWPLHLKAAVAALARSLPLTGDPLRGPPHPQLPTPVGAASEARPGRPRAGKNSSPRRQPKVTFQRFPSTPTWTQGRSVPKSDLSDSKI